MSAFFKGPAGDVPASQAVGIGGEWGERSPLLFSVRTLVGAYFEAPNGLGKRGRYTGDLR